MRNILLLAFLFAVGITHHCSAARIGETPEQCITRYGEPVSRDRQAGQMLFIKNGFAIVADFYEGRCASLLFTKLEADVMGQPRQLSDEVTSALLFVNGNGSPWKRQAATKTALAWITEDGSLIAFMRVQDQMVITTRAAWNRQIKNGGSELLTLGMNTRK